MMVIYRETALMAVTAVFAIGLSMEHHQVKLNKGVEYCNMQKFNVTCEADEVLLIEKAQYGRMHLGRCVKDDLGGYVGCGGDALPYVDGQCSGKQQCLFDIPNTELAKYTQCPKELVNYMEVLHHCVKVIEKKNMACRTAHTLSSTSGYLSSAVAVEHRLGTDLCPWKISVGRGQRVVVYVMHFSPIEIFPKLDGSCISYGQVRESGGGSQAIAVCLNDKRQSRVYTSSGNQVEITFDSSSSLQGLAPILVKYEADGCADLPPQEGRRVMRKTDSDNIEIRCNNSNDVWFATCKGTQWEGLIGNCTSGSDAGKKMSTDTATDTVYYTFPYKLALVVAAGVALGVFLGGTLLLCANMYLKKKHMKRQKDLYGCDLEYKFNRDHALDCHTLQRHAYQRVESSIEEQALKTSMPRSRLNSEDLLSPIEQAEQQPQQQKATVGYSKEYSTYPPPPYDTNRGVIQLNCKSPRAGMGGRKPGHVYEHPMTCPN